MKVSNNEQLIIKCNFITLFLVKYFKVNRDNCTVDFHSLVTQFNI
jgi:hypothetical protein